MPDAEGRAECASDERLWQEREAGQGGPADAAEIETLSVTVVEEAWNGRVDRYLTEVAGHLSRNQLQKRCRALRVNGAAAKPSRKVQAGDSVVVELLPEPRSELTAEAIPFSVLFENRDVLVLNKPRGMVVHPGAGNWSGTVAHGLLHHVAELSGDLDDLRPGIVHRLDKETSGVLICAKHLEAKEQLSRQFADRTTEKRYLAICKGVPRPLHGSVAGTIARDPANRKRFRFQPQGGKPAETEYRTLRIRDGYALVLLSPRTGRTHQLRVHMAHLGAPILGDPVYARRDARFSDARLCLHAIALTIVLPGERSARRFSAVVPQDMRQIISNLFLR